MHTGLKKILKNEEKRQKNAVNLIASENYISDDVRTAMSSVFTAKYAEGFPHKRYYQGTGGCDALETWVENMARTTFGLSEKSWDVAVQAHSGSIANLAVYHALVPKGAKIMALSLDMGGHLSHGAPVSLTGQLWKHIAYPALDNKGRIDYDALSKKVRRERPHMIVVGQSAYPRLFSYAKIRSIARDVGALVHVDVSHEAGLIAGGALPSPFRHTDTVMMTTHKTLRGPRGAIIFMRKDARKLPDKIYRAIFPGLQGGPHMHTIAGIGQALAEAQSKKFATYAGDVVACAQALASTLQDAGWKLVSGGTDNHMVLVDVYGTIGMSGKRGAEMLEKNNIIVNANMIPDDTRSPRDPSGIRLGTPAMVTRGWKAKDFVSCARRIDAILGT